jgi:hypothetical protein
MGRVSRVAGFMSGAFCGVTAHTDCNGLVTKVAWHEGPLTLPGFAYYKEIKR